MAGAVASPSAAPPLAAGLDGCRGGWIAAMWDGSGPLRLVRLDCLADLFDGLDAPRLAAVDIPIGLPDRVGPKGRAPERLVRPLLGGRQSSVFSVPSRAAVEAGLGPDEEGTRYRAACATARATSDPPRAVAKQSFHIFPKIAEADLLLRTQPPLRERLLECHPEVAFWALNGEKALDLPKKVKGRPFPEGIALRLRLLAAAGIPTDALSAQTALALKAGLDDLVDAAACLWTARRAMNGKALRFPDPPERDTYGLPVAIHA